MASVGEQAARGAAWNIATSLGTRGLGLAGTLTLTRFIAPADYGEFNAAFVCLVTANVVTNVRFGQYLIAKRASPEAAYQSHVIHVALGILGFGLVYLLRDTLGALVDAPMMGRFLPGLALALIIERYGYIAERTLVRDLRFRAVSTARSAGEVAFVIVAVALAPWLGAMAMVIANVGRSLLTTALYVRASRWADWGRRAPLRWTTIREMFVYSVPLAIGTFAEFASSNWDNLLFSRFYGPRQLGMYNLAYNLASTPTGTIGEQLADVLFPSLAKLEPERRQDALVRATSVMGLVVFPLAVGLGAVASTVVRLFFDARWQEVAPMLTILSVLSVARPVAWPIMAFLQVQHRQRATMLLSLLHVVLLLALVVAVHRWGPLAACVAVGATVVLHASACIVLARWLEGVPIMRIFVSLVPVIAACTLMSLAVLGARQGLQMAGSRSAALSLIAEIVAGAVVYVGASFVVARKTCDDLIAQVRGVLRRRASRPAPDAP